MANQIGHIVIDKFQSDGDGDLILNGYKARFVMRHGASPRMRANGVVELDPIDSSDTVAEWWQKVKDQVTAKDTEDENAFNTE